MSATEALDAYLERQRNSQKTSNNPRGISSRQDQHRDAAAPPAHTHKEPQGTSRLRHSSKALPAKAGTPEASGRDRSGSIKAVWPPPPLDDKDDRPQLAKMHPATARGAQRKLAEANSGDQVYFLSLAGLHIPSLRLYQLLVFIARAIPKDRSHRKRRLELEVSLLVAWAALGVWLTDGVVPAGRSAQQAEEDELHTGAPRLWRSGSAARPLWGCHGEAQEGAGSRRDGSREVPEPHRHRCVTCGVY